MSEKNISSGKMESIVSLAKRRGFIYQGSEIYGGLSGTWDFGPLGITLKRNIMNLWWKMFIEDREDMFGVDAAILMNQRVWKASGHVDTFSDPLTVCQNCNNRQRVDKIIDEKDYKDFLNNSLNELYKTQWDNYVAKTKEFEKLRESNQPLKDQIDHDMTEFKKLQDAKVSPEVYSKWLGEVKNRNNEYKDNLDTLDKAIDFRFAYLDVIEYIQKETDEARSYLGKFAQTYLDSKVDCPICGERSWTPPKRFNMMLKTHIGPVDDESNISYLRPETAQGIFTNYKNIVDSFYPNLPFGVGQQGKAFRNEISPRDFIFRSREFEQMEIEYFVDPTKWEESFEMWRKLVWDWCAAIGLPRESVHELEVAAEDRAHYSKRTIDFEFDFPIGREELLGLAYRGSFDLDNINRESGKGMEYIVKGTNVKLVPHVIEPSFGVERAIMAVLSTAYTEDEINGEKRIFLKLPEHLAPIRYAVSPLLKNKPELVAKAREAFTILKKKYGAVMWDDNGNIGKRYRRQDEIGTPYCVVIDFDTLEDGTVTVRDRDTTEQKRVRIDEL